MSLDSAFLWAFLAVFARCSALLLSSPLFGAQSTPVHVRVLTTLAISGALTVAIQPNVGPPPETLYAMGASLGNEILCGLILGLFVQVAFSAFQMAGALLDMQVGLGMSQQINPATGVPSTLLAQYKTMLATVVFFAAGGHQVLLGAFVDSYATFPTLGAAHAGAIAEGFVELVTSASLLALQIAAPVAAIGFVVDVAMGIVNRAVPQMPVFLVGIPAKIGLGIAALSLTVPAVAAAVGSCVDLASEALSGAFR